MPAMLKCYVTFLLVVLLILSVEVVFGQEDYRDGYIVHNNGDTTRGFCLFQISSARYNKCKFKTAVVSDPITYTGNQIQAYGFTDGTYYSYQTELNKFAEVYASGKVSLLNSEEVFYLKSSDGKLHELINTSKTVEREYGTYQYENKEYLGILNWILADCKHITEKIKKTDLAPKSLTSLINSYNNCMGQSSVTSKKKKKFIVTQIGLLSLYSNVRITSLSPNTDVSSETRGAVVNIKDFVDLSKFTRTSASSYGGYIEISPVRMAGKISITMEVLYQAVKFSSFYTYSDTYITKNNSYSQDISSVKIPIHLKYSFKREHQKIYPFVYTGVSFNQNQTRGSSEKVLASYATSSINYYLSYQWNNTLNISSLTFSFMSGAGVRADFTKRLSAQLITRFEYGSGPFSFAYDGSPNMLTKQTLLSAGLALSYAF